MHLNESIFGRAGVFGGSSEVIFLNFVRGIRNGNMAARLRDGGAERPLLIHKLLVDDSDTCVQLLRYLDKNIRTFVKNGVRIKIVDLEKESITEETVRGLQSSGVTAFPALVPSEGGRPIIGYKNIVGLMERGRQKILGYELGTPVDSIEDYMHSTIMEGAEYSTGKGKHKKTISFRDEDEGMGDDGKDLNKKLAAYKPPRHRRGDEEKDADVGGDNRRRRRRHDDSDEEEDNDPPPPPRAPGRAPTDNIVDDVDIHEQMFQVLMA